MEITQDDVTAIITNYNYGVYIDQCVKSVMNGKVVPKTIIIIDDGSIDNSLDIISNYSDKCRIIAHSENIGITRSYNHAISKVNTSWAFFLDADNIVNRDYVSDFLVTVNKYPNAGIVYSDIFIFGRNAEPLAKSVDAIRYFESEIKEYAYLWNFREFDSQNRSYINEENFIHGNSFFKVEAFRKVGGLGHLKPEDHELWKALIRIGVDAVKMETGLLGYRQHSPTQAQNIVTMKHIISSQALRILELEDALSRSNSYSSRFIHFLVRRRRLIGIINRVKYFYKKRIENPQISKLENAFWAQIKKIKNTLIN